MDQKRKILFYIARLVICIALLAFAFQRYDASLILSQLKNIDMRYFLLAWALNYFSIFLSTVKWYSILKNYGDKPSLANLWALYVEGQFFNLLFPGFIAGDMSRAVRASSNQSPSSVTFMSVFVERFTGLVTFCIVIGLVALLGGYRSLAAPWYSLIAGLFLSGIMAVIAVFKVDLLNEIPRYVPGLLRKPVEKFTAKISGAVNIITRRKRLLWQLPFYSLLFLMMTGPVAYFSSRSVGVEIPLPILMIYAPLIAFMSSLPVSIAGLGVRENLAVYFYGSLGFQPEEIIAYALAQSTILFLVNLSGGFILLFRTARRTSPDVLRRSYKEDVPEN